MSPAWMDKENEETRRAASEADARNRQRADVEAKIANQGAGVFQRFVRELKANTDALPTLIGQEISGSTSPQANVSCTVCVNWGNIQRGPNSIMWHFHSSASGIRLVTGIGEDEVLFLFRLDAKGEVGIRYGTTVVTPEKMAELTIKEMRDRAMGKLTSTAHQVPLARG